LGGSIKLSKKKLRREVKDFLWEYVFCFPPTPNFYEGQDGFGDRDVDNDVLWKSLVNRKKGQIAESPPANGGKKVRLAVETRITRAGWLGAFHRGEQLHPRHQSGGSRGVKSTDPRLEDS